MAKQKENSNALSGTPRINKVSLFGRVISGFQQNFKQIFSSFSELWKTPFATVMTILVLGVALSLPSVFQVIYKNTERVTNQWDKASEISLFLKKDISEQRVQVLINKLSLYSDIETVTHITSNQALEEFKEMSGFSKALDYLEDNPLPDVLVIVPTPDAMNIASSKLLVAKLQREPDIDLVRVDIDWIEKLQAIYLLSWILSLQLHCCCCYRFY
ncbi:permease-like cell division protein FtsX [Psychromonas sp. MME2]|uniref:cell division protein FtsX n=1 Tax=Psychromonas sp. MME2 TaxID=3231033 RepID=UPI00339C9227